LVDREWSGADAASTRPEIIIGKMRSNGKRGDGEEVGGEGRSGLEDLNWEIQRVGAAEGDRGEDFS
jgi:hypothetical protein